MNLDQLTSMLRVLLAAGGPIAGLMNNAGMNKGTVDNILTIALMVIPPLAAFVWGQLKHTDKNTIASAAAVPGVTMISVAPLATGGASAAASDPALPTVKKVP